MNKGAKGFGVEMRAETPHNVKMNYPKNDPASARTRIPARRHPKKPLLIYDGDCGFCREGIRCWRKLTGDHIEYQPYQTDRKRFPEISPERFTRAVQLIEPNGRVTEGAQAIYQTLAARPGLRWVGWCYDHLPGFKWFSNRLYSLVAYHRHWLSTQVSCDSPKNLKPLPVHPVSRLRRRDKRLESR